MEHLATQRDQSDNIIRSGVYVATAALLLGIVGSPVKAQDAQRNFDVEFSLDIGSDTEMSDPFADGDEVFDPGDMYRWRSAVLFGPTDGIWDDKFPYAPWLPTPEPGFAHPGGFPDVAPVCDTSFPASEIRREYLDVDASDSIDIPLWDFIPPNQPLDQPIPQVATLSIHFPHGVILSYDDDKARPYNECDVPVTTTSPLGATYGSAGGNDEIFAYDYAPGLPLIEVDMAAVASEKDVHENLAPNANFEQDQDDDIDALDLTEVGQDGPHWPFWLWSVDHEAIGMAPSPLAMPNPGHIYYWDGATMGTLLKAEVHFGLREGVDIDAFELIWLELDPDFSILGAMFSVDDDDPSTPGVDESGGLDPTVVYGSALDGSSFVLIEEPFRDDVDALAAWCDPIVRDPTWDPGTACPPDLAPPFGVLNFFDIAEFISLYTGGDLAADFAAPFGVLNFFDVSAFITAYNAGCP